MKINISLIRDSFKAIKPHAEDFTEHFYNELFTRYPAAEELFAKTKMTKQKKALAASLAHIVDFWEDTAHLEDYLFKMGERHVKYSTEEAHFPLVAEALLATFEYFFDAQWTDELKNNWVGVFQTIQKHMLRGMEAAIKRRKELPAPPPSLEEMARQVARDAFKRAFEEEAGEAMLSLAREKAQEILRKALESEAKEVMRFVKKAA